MKYVGKGFLSIPVCICTNQLVFNLIFKYHFAHRRKLMRQAQQCTLVNFEITLLRVVVVVTL